MVFLTQVVLIAFVVTDIFDSELHSCRDGTPGCPVVGTLGSWGFYVLGIFMANVFLLGPKTSFGQSEQNPAFWLQLLLEAKETGTKVSWTDEYGQAKSRVLQAGDARLWIRFIMSFLINGVGFHILVHALPIQVAAQSSLTGVVFRAVGMMYLVDLDDTAGSTLYFVNLDNEKEKEPADNKGEDSPTASGMDEGEVAVAAEQIIAEAKAKLDALAAGQSVSVGSSAKAKAAGGALLLAGSAAGVAVAIDGDKDGGAEGDDGGEEDGGGFEM